MNTMLAHTIALSFVLAACGSLDANDDSFGPQEEGVEDSADPTGGAHQNDSDAPDTDSAEAAAEEQSSDDDRTQRSDGVFRAHVPRLPE